MGALRKTAPEILQPTQIIIFPVDQARPDFEEGLTWWEKFQQSEIGDLVLFEAKMFAIATVLVALIGTTLVGGYGVKQAIGYDFFPESSSSKFLEAPNPTYDRAPHVIQ